MKAGGQEGLEQVASKQPPVDRAGARDDRHEHQDDAEQRVDDEFWSNVRSARVAGVGRRGSGLGSGVAGVGWVIGGSPLYSNRMFDSCV